MSATQRMYECAVSRLPPIPEPGECWLCGGPVFDGVPVSRFVKETFTDFDKTRGGSDVVCAACVWTFTERSVELMHAVGAWWASAEQAVAANPERVQLWRSRGRRGNHALPRPEDIGLQPLDGGWGILQKMRNYSHILKGGVWHPLSKGDKQMMQHLLLDNPAIPELAVISESGQKHLIFRARLNPPGQSAGWLQFEEQAVWIERDGLAELCRLVMRLLVLGFSKTEIDTGRFLPHRVARAGLAEWQALETQAKSHRGAAAWRLAVFLSTKDESESRDAGKPALSDLARNGSGAQDALPDDDLE